MTIPRSAAAQTSAKITTWYENTPDANAVLDVTSIRLGCSSTPDFCFTEMGQVASSQDVQSIDLSIQMDPTTSATYAAQFSQWSLTNPILTILGFDDLVGRMGDIQVQFGLAQPGTVVTDTVNAAKSANPSLKFAITMYEDQLASPLLADSNLPLSTREGVDYVQLYVHYRGDGPNYPTYLEQTKTLFPNAKIIAGAYAYDRIAYLPCLPKGVPCTIQEEEDFFQQLFLLQISELQQGLVDQIEFFPGYFGLEAQWPEWTEVRRCAVGGLPTCIANTLVMRQMVTQDLTAAFGPPGPLTSLSPRPLAFPVQNVSTTSGASTVTLNNPGSSALNIGSIAIVGASAADFSQHNTCPTSLAANTSCSINITFTPSTIGAIAAQLSVTDNARRSPHFMDLSGEGANPSSPQVLLSPTALNFQDQAVATVSAPLALLLSNPGGGDLSITSIVITGSSASQFAETNNCGASVVPAGTCTINVTFTPATADNQSAQLVITDSAVGSPQTIPLTGIGDSPVEAQATFSATVLSFASQTSGTTSAAQTVTLSNPGTIALAISQVTLSGTNATDFAQTNTCGTSLAVGKTCTFSVSFKPSASGPRAAQMLIADDANGSPQSVTLTGTGAAVPAPVVALSPASITFPSQTVKTASTAVPVTLTNTGSAALTLTTIGISGADAADFTEINTCGTTLASNANCTVNISFTPAVPGSRSAQLQIIDNAAGSPQTLSLTGTGAANTAPVAALSPTTLAFPSQTINTTSASAPVTLSNTGNAPLSLTSINFAGANAAEFNQTDNCGTSVAAGASCIVNITFTPAGAGARSAQLQVVDNAAGSPQTLALTGTGTAVGGPSLTLNPASVNFGNQSVGVASAASVVVIGNSGSSGLTIASVTISGANATDFSETNSCSGTIAAGSSCSVSVIFTPTISGSRSAQILVTDNAAGSPNSISLSGSGTSVATPDFAISALPPSATLAAGQSMNVTLSVSGSGGFSQPVTFACSGLPAQAACSFSPASVTPSASSAGSTTLTVTTVSRSAAVIRWQYPPLPLLYETALRVFAVCLLFVFYKRTSFARVEFRASSYRRLTLLAVLVAASLAGCSSAGSSPPPPVTGAGSTPAGSYVITVTALSGTLSHQVKVSLTVN